MRAGLTSVEWCAFAFAVLAALGFLGHELYFPSQYDAVQYQDTAHAFATNGLFAPFPAARLRTYGYPYLLSLVIRGAGTLGVPFPIAVFVLQIAFYVAACLFFRKALMRVSAPAGRIAFVGMMANYYVLIYTPQTLTESVSISLLVLAGGCWLEATRKGASPVPLVVGSLAVGFAVMVRPANVFMVVAWLVGILVWWRRARPPAARAFVAGACVVAALALPALPQLANNVRHFGEWTPLVVDDLGKMQQVWGIHALKYATGVKPVSVAPIYYNNPLVVGTTVDTESPWRWYLEYPERGALTLALHTFNLLDQDLLFTYSRDLDPWYRLPLGVVNHAVVGMGLIGLLIMIRRAFVLGPPEWRDATTVLLVLVAANWAVYAWTAVEMRFGSVLLLVLFPLAGYAGMQVAAAGRVRTISTALAVALYVGFASMLSSWVRDQAPAIKSAIDSHDSAPARS